MTGWFPDPTDFLKLAVDNARLQAQLVNEHAEHLAGQGGDSAVQQEAADGSSPCAVIRLDSRRKPA